MDENKDKIHISETQLPTDFQLDDILAEFGGAPEDETAQERLDTLEDRSKKLVMEQLSDGMDALDFSSLDDVISDAVAGERDAAQGEAPDSDLADAGFEVPKAEPDPCADPDAVIREALLEYGSYAAPPAEPETPPAPTE